MTKSASITARDSEHPQIGSKLQVDRVRRAFMRASYGNQKGLTFDCFLVDVLGLVSLSMLGVHLTCVLPLAGLHQ